MIKVEKISKEETQAEKLAVTDYGKDEKRVGRTAYDLIHDFFEDDFLTKSVTNAFGGIILTLTVFSILWNRYIAHTQIFLPFLDPSIDKEAFFGATPNAMLRQYKYIGEAGLTFNEIFKLAVFLFVIWIIFKLFFNIVIKRLPSIIVIFSKWVFFHLKLTPHLPYMLRKKVYRVNEWLAIPKPIFVNGKPIFPPSRKRILLEHIDFRSIKFNVSVLKNDGHWRVGIFIVGTDKSRDYVFHLFKDRNDMTIKSRMTMRNFTKGKHINPSDKNLSIADVDNFIFEVKKVGEDMYALVIDNNEVDRYRVPKSSFESIEIGAWADDLIYNVRFSNIEFVG